MPAIAQHAAAPALQTCPSCRQGHLQPTTRERVFQPHGQTVRVELQTSICDHCAAEAPSTAQHQGNLQRLSARKAQYGGLLLGEEIAALRRKYGLTQQQASRIFGKGKIAFSRYESETTYPDASTTKLLAMAIARPDALKWLADEAGEYLPLWHAPCEDRPLALQAEPAVLPPVRVPGLKRAVKAETRPGDEAANVPLRRMGAGTKSALGPKRR